MHPFVLFAIILLVIWALSALGTMINKQQEAERRRKFREMMEQEQGGPQRFGRQPQTTRRTPPPPPLNPEFAVRHPEMLAWPSPPVPPPPAPAPQQRRPAPAARRPAPQPMRQQQTMRVTRQTGRRGAGAVMPPPIPVFQEDEAPARRRLAPAAAPVQPIQPPAAQTATAPAIARWLQPNTLRQQFILTEILQPPLAMRESHLHD